MLNQENMPISPNSHGLGSARNAGESVDGVEGEKDVVDDDDRIYNF